MNNLFMVLLLLSIVGLCVGLVKPPLFKMKSRKQASLIFGGCFVLFFILFGVTAPSSQTPTSTPVATQAPATSASVPTVASATPAVQTAPQPVPTVDTTPTPAPYVPQTLLSVSGEGIKSTKSFSADGDWELSYTYDCSNWGQKGNFQIFIESEDGGMSDIGANELGMSGSDTNYYHDGGTYYLKINSECNWTVKVKG